MKAHSTSYRDRTLEISSTLAVAIYMGGGPSLMYSADALAALDQFQRLATEAAA